MEKRDQSSRENGKYVLQVDSSVHLTVDGGEQTMGVKALARMFSARSKEQGVQAPLGSPKGSPVRSKQQKSPIASAKANKSDPKYQNIFDDPRFIRKTNSDVSLIQAKGKKPVPTPRKAYSPEELAANESSDDDDGYTPMSTTIAELHSLKNEIDLLKNVADLPPLHASKQLRRGKVIFTNSSSSSSGNVRVGFTERKRVLDTRGGGDKDCVTVGFSVGDSSDGDETSEYYLPVLPDIKYTNASNVERMNSRNDVIHRRITTNHNGQLLSLKDWKRSQGSIFAEEMIDLMSTDGYVPTCNTGGTGNVRNSSHSYMEIDENRLRNLPIRRSSSSSPEPVYIQAEEGCDGEYVDSEPVVSPKHPEAIYDLASNCPVSPPNLFPKSLSLLREQEQCLFDSNPKEVEYDYQGDMSSGDISSMTDIQHKQSKKAGKLIKAFKTQPFTMNKKKKKLSPVISSPRLPLYPPNKKVPDLTVPDKSPSSSESDIYEPSPLSANQPNTHSKPSVSTSISLSPSPGTTTPSFEDIQLDSYSPGTPVEFQQLLTSPHTTSQPLRRTCSDGKVKNNIAFANQRSSSMSTCSNPETSHEQSEQSDDEDKLPVVNRPNRANTATPRIRGLEESVGPNSLASKRVFGYFTCQGGTLASRESGVYINIPPDAVPKGKRQKIWFEVLQTMYKEGKESIMESVTFTSSKEVENSSQTKRESAVQLSLTALVGPSDAVLNKPIKVFIPHCATVDSTVWNLKVIGRASQSDDWEQLVPSGTHFKPSLPKQKKYKNSTYKIYSDHFRVKTRHVGCFRMTGKPVGQNLAKLNKKMVSSVYCQRMNDEVRVKVFITNAFLDSIETLYHVMLSEGYTCIERNIPTICSGDHSDLRVSLLVETNQGKVATCMQVIPFEMFWRVTRVGKAVATFDLSGDELLNSKVMKIELYQREDAQQVFEVLLPF